MKRFTNRKTKTKTWKVILAMPDHNDREYFINGASLELNTDQRAFFAAVAQDKKDHPLNEWPPKANMFKVEVFK